MIDSENKKTISAIEALLFVSTDPVTSSRLSDILGISISKVDECLCELASEYEEEERGIQLREVAGGWRLYTHPGFHDIVEKYVLSWDTQKLSQAALEALSVIAYNQPATRATVSSIRGVNSDGVISSLIEKGLIKEAGRDNTPGQPILYATTKVFLERFGLKSLSSLPALEDFAPNEETKQLIKERLSARKIVDMIDDGDDELPENDDIDNTDDMKKTRDIDKIDEDDLIELIN